MIASILGRLQANQDSLCALRGAFPHFVRTVLVRCFADLVRPFSQCTPLSPDSPYPADSSLNIYCLFLLVCLMSHYHRLLLRRSTSHHCQLVVQRPIAVVSMRWTEVTVAVSAM
jgi:hypothetical protein